MPLPHDDYIYTAIEWLRANNAGGDEQEGCEVVADYLDSLLRDRTLRTLAREAGVPVAKLRAKVAQP